MEQNFEGNGSSQQRYALAEEGRVKKSPPPPLWDENVEERFVGKSFVFDDGFQSHLKAWVVEEISPQCSMQGNIPLMHSAVCTGDLPLLRALGRYNCDLNFQFGPNKFTPLHLLIITARLFRTDSTSQPDSLTGGTPNAEVVEWLLSRGVNIHTKDSRNHSPFHSSLSYMRSRVTGDPVLLDLDICKLLLLYGADPNEIRMCNDPTVVRELMKYAKEMDSKRVSRPPYLCPCGNNVPVETCHGAENGVPVHRRMLCPCRSGKIYGKCCFKRRYYFRETLTSNIAPPRTVTDQQTIQHLLAYSAQHDTVLKGLPIEERENIPFLPTLTSEVYSSISNRVIDIIVSTKNNGRIDPCFLWCAKHPKNDFSYARSWRRNGWMKFDKNEGIKRRDEWNGWVDEYILRKLEFRDARADDDIERLCKVNSNGSALWRHCGRNECPNVETKDSPKFAHCGRCNIVVYCSRDCQSLHWKVHKKECGEDRTEQLLPSTMAFDEHFSTILNNMSK